MDSAQLSTTVLSIMISLQHTRKSVGQTKELWFLKDIKWVIWKVESGKSEENFSLPQQNFSHIMHSNFCCKNLLKIIIIEKKISTIKNYKSNHY